MTALDCSAVKPLTTLVGEKQTPFMGGNWEPGESVLVVRNTRP